MDPQQRLFLEEAWKALEHAGHAGASMEGAAAACSSAAAPAIIRSCSCSQPPGQAVLGQRPLADPARIAYCLDLKGPAIAVDTALLELARCAWISPAAACGAAKASWPLRAACSCNARDRFFRYADAARMLSPFRRCAAFGAEADGIVPAEAVAAGPAAPALGGVGGWRHYPWLDRRLRHQSGWRHQRHHAAPSGVSQQSLMREVYDAFGIDAVERRPRRGAWHRHPARRSHRIRRACQHLFFSRHAAAAGCFLGSVKSNLGPRTTAAGITSLVKVLGALKSGIVPPTLHVGTGNPAICVEEGPVPFKYRSPAA